MVKNLPANAEDPGSIPGLGRFPGEGNGKALQDSSPGNFMGRGAWQAAADGVTESDATERLTLSVSKQLRAADKVLEILLCRRGVFLRNWARDDAWRGGARPGSRVTGGA